MVYDDNNSIYYFKSQAKFFILQLNLTVPENINTTQIKRKFIVKMFHIFSHYSSLNFCKRNSTNKNISTKINVYHNSKKKKHLKKSNEEINGIQKRGLR